MTLQRGKTTEIASKLDKKQWLIPEWRNKRAHQSLWASIVLRRLPKKRRKHELFSFVASTLFLRSAEIRRPYICSPVNNYFPGEQMAARPYRVLFHTCMASCYGEFRPETDGRMCFFGIRNGIKTKMTIEDEGISSWYKNASRTDSHVAFKKGLHFQDRSDSIHAPIWYQKHPKIAPH